jgi:hypothetical protein
MKGLLAASVKGRKYLRQQNMAKHTCLHEQVFISSRSPDSST